LDTEFQVVTPQLLTLEQFAEFLGGKLLPPSIVIPDRERPGEEDSPRSPRSFQSTTTATTATTATSTSSEASTSSSATSSPRSPLAAKGTKVSTPLSLRTSDLSRAPGSPKTPGSPHSPSSPKSPKGKKGVVKSPSSLKVEQSEDAPEENNAGSPTQSPASEIVGRGVSGMGYLVGLNAMQRLSTFVLNQVVLRHLDPVLMGLASLHFDLFTATALFLSRESFRLALARLPPGLTPSARATSWLVIPAGLVVVSCLLYLYWLPPAIPPEHEEYLTQYLPALALFTAAVMIEVASEPAYVVAHSLLLYRVRVLVEGAAVAVRSISTLALLNYLQPGPICFGLAQVLYSLVLFVGYYGYFMGRGAVKDDPLVKHALARWTELLPSVSHSLDWEVVRDTFKFFQQSVIKLLLTEADRITISLFSSLYEQGVYSLVANYGSLVARLIFLPLEETSRNMFSKLLPNIETLESKKKGRPREMTPGVETGFQIFETLLRLVLYIGLIFVAFGPNYAFSLLDVMLGSKWSQTEAPQVLAWYFGYVLTMALNGITEGFVVSVASRDHITLQNYWMVLSFGGFSVSAYYLMDRFGTTGLVMANCVNMLSRYIYSSWFISTVRCCCFFLLRRSP